MKKILLSGSSGFLGKALLAFLQSKGHTLIPLVRTKNFSGPYVFWDPDHHLANSQDFEGFDIFIHLGAESVATGLFWGKEKKRKIYDSRVVSCLFLADIIAALKHPPEVVFCASATGFYGDRADTVLDENSESGEGFLAKVCKDWEKASSSMGNHVRLIQARFGIILSKEGGMLQKMILPIRLGLGALFGTGEQYISWITREDAIRAIYHLISEKSASGVFNLTSPNPLRERLFFQKLAQVLNRPFFLKIPGKLLAFILGEKSSLLLFSQRVFPKRLQETGFVFANPVLDAALERLFSDFG